MRFLFRRIVSYALDFVIFSLLIGLFTFSINVFYADPAMQDKVLFMFVCALIVSLGLTTYIPVQNKGQTIGQKIMKIFMLHVFRHGVFALKRPYRIYQCDHGGEIN